MHPENRSLVNDALQTMLSGERSNINFTCRMQVKYDEIWRYCNITGVPFEEEENGKISRFTGFRQNISKLHQLNEELKERNYKMELTFETIGMSYWDFDVQTLQYRAFNDSVNDFCFGKAISPEDYLNAAHHDDTKRIRENIETMLRGEAWEFTL